jgi:outer membrane lipoprotein-sorting protein
VALIFDKSSMDLSQWVLTEPNGEEITFSLYDIQKNVKIPKSFFYIDPTFKSKKPDV